MKADSITRKINIIYNASRLKETKEQTRCNKEKLNKIKRRSVKAKTCRASRQTPGRGTKVDSLALVPRKCFLVYYKRVFRRVASTINK